MQINCVLDDQRRSPGALLEAWPTLPAVAAATARAGVDVTVLQASHVAATVSREGVTYRFVPEPRWAHGPGPGIAPWRLAAAARRARADVIHFNGLDFPLHARALGLLGAPVLVQDHASRPDAPIGRLRRWGYAGIAAAAFTAAEQAEPFFRRRQLPADIRVIPVPESSSHFTPGSREEARRETGVFGEPALLWVGRLDSNKDPLTVLSGVRRVLPALPHLQLWCAFAGTELLGEVEQRLREDDVLASHVHLLGKLPHHRIEQLCRAADFFVLGSRREGSGYALLEALACGTTPIVSDIPPFRALTGAGEIGALFPVGDAEALAAAIIRQAGLPRREARLKVRGHFERRLSFDVIGALLVEAYEALARRSTER